jgi:hypothetical protein
MRKLVFILSVVFISTLGIAAISATETGDVVVKVEGVQNVSGWEINAYKVLADSSRTLIAVQTTNGNGEAEFEGMPVGMKVDFVATPVDGFICVPIMEYVVRPAHQTRTITIYPIRNR